jgi:hypothetical protein
LIKFNDELKEIKMLDQNLNDKVISLRRMSAEYYQKAAWNQLLALDNYREKNFEAAERFAQLSFEDQMNAVEFAELADAESLIFLDLNIEEEY